jgi:hypothetical protein
MLLDGQTVRHYHTAEGQKQRRDGAELAIRTRGCWPPCSGDCCKQVRAYLTALGDTYRDGTGDGGRDG